MSSFEILSVCFGCLGFLLYLICGIYHICKEEIWRWC